MKPLICVTEAYRNIEIEGEKVLSFSKSVYVLGIRVFSIEELDGITKTDSLNTKGIGFTNK